MADLEYLTNEEKAGLGEIKQRVQSMVGQRLRGIRLFGSKARGDFDPESDLDIAILVEGLDRDTKWRIIEIVADVELKFLLVVSSLILSWEDFQSLRARERRLALDIESEGVLL
jgi:predicted nucleotidyltransferase